MVEDISPEYYAASELNVGYTLNGVGFNNIPDDAIGVYSNNNNNPLIYINSISPDVLYDITEKDNNRIVLAAREPLESHGANYLGGIISADRQTIYWVNDTKPLP